MDRAWKTTSYALNHCFLNGTAPYIFQAKENSYINLLLGADSTDAMYTIGHRSYRLHAGSNIIYYLRKGDTFRIANSDASHEALLIFAPPPCLDQFHTQFQKDRCLVNEGLTTKSDCRLKLLFDQLYRLDKSVSFHTMRATILLLEIILHQIETMVSDAEQGDHALKSQYEKIMMAKQIIDSDLSKNHSIAELAKTVGTNVQYLKKYFKLYYGKTVMAYMTEQKMEHAKTLIMTGDHLVSDVATMTGYKHAAHFSTVFKKHFGFIPNALKYSVIAQESATFLSEAEAFLHLL